MSAGAAVERHQEQEASNDAEKGNTARRAFNVLCTAASDTAVTVLAASGLPAIGEVFNGAVCKRRIAKKNPPTDANQLNWIVICEYEMPGTGPAWSETPTSQDPEIQIDTDPESVPFDEDAITGNAVENSAGDLFDPPVEKDAGVTVIRITKNYSSWDADDNETWKDTVYPATGTATIAGKTGAAKTFRMKRISAVKKWTPGGSRYFAVTFEIEYRAATHRKFPLDQGLRQLVLTAKFNIKDDNGVDVTEPVKLDGSGYPLAAGQDPVYMEYDAYATADWSSLSLPSAT
ncbi:MAG: hypothetical protein KBA18_09480 [Kiritimatiellae bacterium]|nr:hypothetical protein [Kiritimatiellia bacterium]